MLSELVNFCVNAEPADIGATLPRIGVDPIKLTDLSIINGIIIKYFYLFKIKIFI